MGFVQGSRIRGTLNIFASSSTIPKLLWANTHIIDADTPSIFETKLILISKFSSIHDKIYLSSHQVNNIAVPASLKASTNLSRGSKFSAIPTCFDKGTFCQHMKTYFHWVFYKMIYCINFNMFESKLCLCRRYVLDPSMKIFFR